MIVLQLSDLHVEPVGTLAYGVAPTNSLAERAVEHVLSLKQKPDLVVITGDVASSGKAEAYTLVQGLLQKLAASIPVYVLPGNHDHGPRMREYLAPYCPVDVSIAPHICYTVEHLPMRCVMLDTTLAGSHSGHLIPKVAAWLENTLSMDTERPTLLFMHHPPFLAGMGAMDEPFKGQEEFARILQKHKNVRLCCGHMHRAFTTLWANTLCLCAPSTAMQIDLDLSPEGGDTFNMEAAGYVMHHFDGKHCQSHFCQIPNEYTFSGPHPFVGVINPSE